MKKSLSKSQFIHEFQAIRPDNFTYKGLEALYEWFEEMEESTGQEAEFDPIAICCEFIEYDNIEEFHGDYSPEDYPTLEDIADYTTVILRPGLTGFIIAAF